MNSSGTVVRSNGVIVADSKKLDTGNYLVTFNRNVDSCTAVVSLADTFNGIVSARQIGEPDEVQVFTSRLTGDNNITTAFDIPFALIVAC